MVKFQINPEDICWTMDWGENRDIEKHKERYEQMYEDTGMLASLLINGDLGLNSNWYEHDWSEDAKKTFSIFLNMNDVFFWACSDTENINYDELEDVYKHFEKDSYWGLVIWASKKRGYLPQLSILDSMRKEKIDISLLIEEIKEKFEKGNQLSLSFYKNEKLYKMISKTIREFYHDTIWLPIQELYEAFGRKDLIIGGFFDKINEQIKLVTGDLRTFSLPCEFFKTSGDGIKPNFEKLKITDYGHTVAFGKYEAATDCILEENKNA